MDWYAVDHNGTKWYPYIVTNHKRATEVFLHPEGADTDMGDITMAELSYFSPIVIVAIAQ